MIEKARQVQAFLLVSKTLHRRFKNKRIQKLGNALNELVE